MTFCKILLFWSVIWQNKTAMKFKAVLTYQVQDDARYKLWEARLRVKLRVQALPESLCCVLRQDTFLSQAVPHSTQVHN